MRKRLGYREMLHIAQNDPGKVMVVSIPVKSQKTPNTTCTYYCTINVNLIIQPDAQSNKTTFH